MNLGVLVGVRAQGSELITSYRSMFGKWTVPNEDSSITSDRGIKAALMGWKHLPKLSIKCIIKWINKKGAEVKKRHRSMIIKGLYEITKAIRKEKKRSASSQRYGNMVPRTLNTRCLLGWGWKSKNVKHTPKIGYYFTLEGCLSKPIYPILLRPTVTCEWYVRVS